MHGLVFDFDPGKIYACSCISPVLFVCVLQRQIFRVGKMSRFRRTRHRQNRVSSAKRIGHGFFGVRIGNPFAIHHQAIFVSAGRESRFLPPVADAGGMQGLGFRLPMIECSCDANGLGRRIRKFKTNRHELRAWSVVVVMIVFHGW